MHWYLFGVLETDVRIEVHQLFGNNTRCAGPQAHTFHHSQSLHHTTKHRYNTIALNYILLKIVWYSRGGIDNVVDSHHVLGDEVPILENS